MEKGYYHPSLGYWQTMSTPSAEQLATYPSGTVEIPLKPGPFYDWDGATWVENLPPPPTNAELEAEVQTIADSLTNTDERMMALALATVDLRLVDTSGMTTAQVRGAFKDRVVFYLRERRGI